MLSLKNINLTFDRELIKNGELYVPNEQLTVLFGPSGSGKSSLLYDMAFLTKQVQMDYIFDGIDVHTLSQDEIKDIQKNQNLHNAYAIPCQHKSFRRMSL